MEILRSTTPALLIPRPGPSAEQRTRARLFHERGWVDALAPEDVDSAALAEAIAEGIRHGPARLCSRPDLGGLSAAVDELRSPSLPAHANGAALHSLP